MFEIRPEHVQAFDETARENFSQRACAHLRKTLPSQTASYADEDLAARVRRDGERAVAYGLTWERSKVRFIEASLLLGPDFDHDPRYDWAGIMLRNREFGQEQRSLALVMCAHQATQLDWKEEPDGRVSA